MSVEQLTNPVQIVGLLSKSTQWTTRFESPAEQDDLEKLISAKLNEQGKQPEMFIRSVEKLIDEHANSIKSEDPSIRIDKGVIRTIALRMISAELRADRAADETRQR